MSYLLKQDTIPLLSSSITIGRKLSSRTVLVFMFFPLLLKKLDLFFASKLAPFLNLLCSFLQNML